MSTWARRVSAGACAALILAVAVPTASARWFSTSSQQISAVWSPLNFIVGPFESNTIRCVLSLEGSFHTRTFAKVREALVGYVTRPAIQAPCTNGEFHVLAETPWHLRYEGFTGALPRITSIKLRLVEFSIWFNSALGPRCLYRSTVTNPAAFTLSLESGTPTSAALEVSLPETQAGMCFETIRIEGRGARVTTTATVSLI
jgi:hypothetical protein